MTIVRDASGLVPYKEKSSSHSNAMSGKDSILGLDGRYIHRSSDGVAPPCHLMARRRSHACRMTKSEVLSEGLIIKYAIASYWQDQIG